MGAISIDFRQAPLELTLAFEFSVRSVPLCFNPPPVGSP